jgi:rubredoxin
MRMAKIKCYLCGKVFDEKKLIYTKDPDELMCPLCHEREPGFEEVKEDAAD